MNDVRESLRERYNRSLDPDEIELEMSRDKGFGGMKKKKNESGVELEKDAKDMPSDENSIGSQDQSPRTEQSLSDDGDASPDNPQATDRSKV